MAEVTMTVKVAKSQAVLLYNLVQEAEKALLASTIALEKANIGFNAIVRGHGYDMAGVKLGSVDTDSATLVITFPEQPAE